jgi:hypothetical protein
LYDQQGNIISTTQGKEGDRIVAPPGATLADIDSPKKLENAELADFVHLLQVDVRQNQLVERSQTEVNGRTE